MFYVISGLIDADTGKTELGIATEIFEGDNILFSSDTYTDAEQFLTNSIFSFFDDFETVYRLLHLDSSSEEVNNDGE